MTLLTDEQIREEQRKHQLDSAVQVRGIEVGTHAQLAEIIKDLRGEAEALKGHIVNARDHRVADIVLRRKADEYQAELDARKED